MIQQSRFAIHSGQQYFPYNSDLDGIVYNSKEYQELNDTEKTWYFLVDEQIKKVVGRIIFTQTEDYLLSGAYAPFGAFEFGEYVPHEERSRFIEQVLNEQKGKKVVLKSGPYKVYEPACGLDILDNIYFDKVTTDINHHIDLTTPLQDKIHPMQRRRINKCIKAGFTITEITEPDKLDDVYEFIKKCRKERKLEINISKEKFTNSFKKLKKKYQAFAVLKDEKIISASVLVQTTKDVVYHYLPASLKSMSKYSPMAFLTDYLASYYLERGFTILDWGVTSINGKEQKSLADFKERMGAERSYKKTFYRL